MRLYINESLLLKKGVSFLCTILEKIRYNRNIDITVMESKPNAKVAFGKLIKYNLSSLNNVFILIPIIN
jgi:hypothetical protein